MVQSFGEGQVVSDRYRLVSKLGAGGMGEVWIASHVATSRRVALKVILPQKAARDGAAALERFQREAVALGKIESPYVTQVLDAGTDQASDAAFLVMELFQGEDVEHLIERLGPLSPQLALRIGYQALLGLRAAHEVGIVHRDIKPANLFLSKRADGERTVKVLDFGIAKLRAGDGESGSGRNLTATNSAFGSVPYMSPEQLQSSKHVDARTDLWSIGVTLYQALSGRSPFVDVEDLGAIVLKILQGAPASLAVIAPWVPPEVIAIVERALRRGAGERFQTAAEMAEAIRPLLRNGTAITEDLLVSLPEHLRSQVPVSGLAEPAPVAQAAPYGGSVGSAPVGSGSGSGTQVLSSPVAVSGPATASGAAGGAGVPNVTVAAPPAFSSTGPGGVVVAGTVGFGSGNVPGASPGATGAAATPGGSQGRTTKVLVAALVLVIAGAIAIVAVMASRQAPPVTEPVTAGGSTTTVTTSEIPAVVTATATSTAGVASATTTSTSTTTSTTTSKGAGTSVARPSPGPTASAKTPRGPEPPPPPPATPTTSTDPFGNVPK